MQTKLLDHTTAKAHALPPGSMGLPGIGETLALFLDKDFIAKRRAKYGPIFKTHLLGHPTVCMVGPEAARFVLASHMDHFAWGSGWPEPFRDLLGNSLFVQDGEEHRFNRELLMPAFQGRALAGYFQTIEATIQQYLAKWEQQREFTWYEEYKQLSFDITSQVLLGTSSEEEAARLSRLFTTLTNGMYTPPRGRSLSPIFRRAMAARKEILRHVEQVVRQRLAHPTNDALSMLIQSRASNNQALAFEQITAQAMLLLFAGHETTTAMITCICLELGRHPEVLQRARQEQMQLAAHGPLRFDDLKCMPYLDQVLREVERLHAPGIGGFRAVVKPFEFNGYTVPAGWRVHYSIYGTHRTESIYPDPERFDPERFSPARAEHKQQAFSLIGYGGGPRICIGKSLAQVEMKMILAHLLRAYQWDLLPNQRLDTVLFPSIHPKDGLKVYFRRWYPERKHDQALAETTPAADALPTTEHAQVQRCPYSGAVIS